MGDVFLSAISLCWQFETEQASFQPWGNADKRCGRSSTACGRGSHTCARTLFVFCCASGAIKPSLKPCLNQKKQILIWQLFIQMLFIAINFSFTDLSLQMLLFHWQAETCHESAPLANLEKDACHARALVNLNILFLVCQDVLRLPWTSFKGKCVVLRFRLDCFLLFHTLVLFNRFGVWVAFESATCFFVKHVIPWLERHLDCGQEKNNEIGILFAYR